MFVNSLLEPRCENRRGLFFVRLQRSRVQSLLSGLSGRFRLLKIDHYPAMVAGAPIVGIVPGADG